MLVNVWLKLEMILEELKKLKDLVLQHGLKIIVIVKKQKHIDILQSGKIGMRSLH